jgi:hypothetical protein
MHHRIPAVSPLNVFDLKDSNHLYVWKERLLEPTIWFRRNLGVRHDTGKRTPQGRTLHKARRCAGEIRPAEVFASGSAVSEIERLLACVGANEGDFYAVEAREAGGLGACLARRYSTMSKWFGSLTPERRAILREDSWMFAEAAFAAGKL